MKDETIMLLIGILVGFFICSLLLGGMNRKTEIPGTAFRCLNCKIEWNAPTRKDAETLINDGYLKGKITGITDAVQRNSRAVE